MERTNQTVHIKYDENNQGTIRNQTITNIVIDDECYAAGLWKGKIVISYHVDSNVWAVAFKN